MNSIERIGIGTVVLSLGWAAGCASTVEVAEPSGEGVDGKWLYWVERGTHEAHMEDGTVRRMLKSGGPGAVVAENQTSPTAVVLDDQAVFWLNSGHPAEADGAVMRASK